MLDITDKPKTILELGCGFGRSLSFLSQLAEKVVAIDISEAMIEKAKKNNSHLKNITYHIAEGEKINYPDNYFDIIICYGVFDALYQEQALCEMHRVIKNKGKLLLTGKNDNYNSTDKKALTAEINSRKKNHPNFFTNVYFVLKNINEFGFKVHYSHFFEMRGDASLNRYVESMPDIFYEFRLILEKNGPYNNYSKFSSKYSKTFLTIQKNK